MKWFKALVSIVAALALVLSVVPLSVFAVEIEVTVTSWDELRDALQADGEAEITIPEDVTIERTFDVSEYIDDVKITVNGKKKLNLCGDIHVYNNIEKVSFYPFSTLNLAIVLYTRREGVVNYHEFFHRCLNFLRKSTKIPQGIA